MKSLSDNIRSRICATSGDCQFAPDSYEFGYRKTHSPWASGLAPMLSELQSAYRSRRFTCSSPDGTKLQLLQAKWRKRRWTFTCRSPEGTTLRLLQTKLREQRRTCTCPSPAGTTPPRAGGASRRLGDSHYFLKPRRGDTTHQAAQAAACHATLQFSTGFSSGRSVRRTAAACLHSDSLR